jgi:hypothetical protein
MTDVAVHLWWSKSAIGKAFATTIPYEEGLCIASALSLQAFTSCSLRLANTFQTEVGIGAMRSMLLRFRVEPYLNRSRWHEGDGGSFPSCVLRGQLIFHLRALDNLAIVLDGNFLSNRNVQSI